MNVLRLLLDDGSVNALGWTLISALWQTLGLALAYAVWRLLARGASASARHAVACGTLLMALTVFLASFWAFRYAGQARGASLLRSLSWNSWRQPVEVRAAEAAVPLLTFPSGVDLTLDDVIPCLVVLWLAGVSCLVIHLLGGLVLIRRIRRSGMPLGDSRLLCLLSRLGVRIGLRRQVVLLQSDQVEAPAVVGWRQPVIVLPKNVVVGLPLPLLEPVIAHELGHIQRRDFAINLAQTGVDVLLFFCPAARWLSRQARKAREEGCDDLAARLCGGAANYARALGHLASLGSHRHAAALGATGPSLADRIRRLLEGEPMPTRSLARTITLVASMVATGLAGWTVTDIALGHAEQKYSRDHAQVADNGWPEVIQATGMTLGYIYQQPGSPVFIERTTATGSHVFAGVEFRNVSRTPLRSVMFVAIVEARAPEKLGTPAEVIQSPRLAASLTPGASMELGASLLSVERALKIQSRLGGHTQAVLGILAVEFSDGKRWEAQLKHGASTVEEALRTRPDPSNIRLSSSRLSAQPASGDPGDLCRDDDGLAYSEGAIVPVLGEINRFAACIQGVWVDHSGAPRPR
jgi:beta-lactamase regulating signal transducer with metallopeptidase domain